VFDHSDIQKYSFEEVPLDRDLYLMDEKWLPEYEAMLTGFLRGERDYETIGYISYAAARRVVGDHAIELSWYPNVFTRFHEMRILLPRDQFVCCVASWQCDEKPRIFVRSAWLSNLHLRTHSAFALIDAIGVKRALERGELTRERLIGLRDAVDELAARYPDVSFISLADNLLLKSNWSVGQFDSNVTYTYEPEIMIRVISELREVYGSVLGLGLYAVLTQGLNAYYDDALLHTSRSGNHISLNSLGLPFAQLLAIDEAARTAIRRNEHPPAELYLDEDFFRSLTLKYGFQRDACPVGYYRSPMMAADATYYMSSCAELLSNVEAAKE
jgi:hypothetical protein